LAQAPSIIKASALFEKMGLGCSITVHLDHKSPWLNLVLPKSAVESFNTKGGIFDEIQEGFDVLIIPPARFDGGAAAANCEVKIRKRNASVPVERLESAVLALSRRMLDWLIAKGLAAAEN